MVRAGKTRGKKERMNGRRDSRTKKRGGEIRENVRELREGNVEQKVE
jgi:hypothetical protein